MKHPPGHIVYRETVEDGAIRYVPEWCEKCLDADTRLALIQSDDPFQRRLASKMNGMRKRERLLIARAYLGMSDIR